MVIGGFELADIFNGNLLPNFFEKLSESISSNFSFFNDALQIVVNLFNYLSNIIIWISSYTGLYPATVICIIGLIAGGLGIVISSFLLKIIVKWWSVLVP